MVVCFLILTFLFIIPLFISNLIEERNLNAIGWSRSIDLQESAINKSTFQRVNNNGMNLYFAESNSSIKKIEIDPQTLIVKDQNILKVPSNPYYKYWLSPDDKEMVYLANETLYRFTSTGNQTLHNQVDELSVNEETILFLSGTKVFSVDTKEFSTTELFQDEKLLHIALDQNSPSYVSLHKYGEVGGIEFKYHKWNGEKYISNSVYIKDSFTQPVTNIDFAEWNNQFTLIYETTDISGGGKEVTHHYMEIPLIHSQKGEDRYETKLKVFDSNFSEITTVREIRFEILNGKLKMILEGNGELKESVHHQNLYIATVEDGRWVADRISTNYDPVVKPLITVDNFASWMIHDGRHYKIIAANTSQNIIKDSRSITSNDVGKALEDTLFGLTSSLVMLLFTVLLVVPALIIIFISKFFEVKNTKKAELITNGIFTICLYFLLTRLLPGNFSIKAPVYLTFNGSLWVILIFVIGISYFVTKLTKHHEWDFEMRVLYFIGLCVWSVSLLVGPYII